MAHELVGRASETAELTGLVRSVLDSTGAGLVLRGEPGVGKTALVDLAEELGRESGLRVVRLSGAEGEVAMPYGVVDRLVRELCGDRVDPRGDRLALCEQVLRAVLEAAQDRGLLCLVDEAHWVDQPSREVLAYVRRRIQGTPVGIVLTTRRLPGSDTDDRVLDVAPLAAADAAALFASQSPRPFDQVGIDRVLAVAAGNPAVLCDLAAALGSSELRQDQLVLQAPPLSSVTTDPWMGGVDSLSEPARTWLLLAATEWSRRLRSIEAAARTIGLPADTCLEVEDAGIVELGDHVVFAHPLVATSILSRSSAPQRRSVHRALAEVGAAEQSPVRAAWHLAGAAVVPDDRAAEHLAEVAGRFDRGMTYLTRSALLARAGELSSDEALRSARLVGAAAHARLAGAPILAEELTAAGRHRQPSGPLTVDPAGGPEYLADEIHTLDVQLRARSAGAGGRQDHTHRVADAIEAWRSSPPEVAYGLMRPTLDQLLGADDDTTVHLYPYGVLLAAALWDAPAVHRLLANAQQVALRRQAAGVVATVGDLTRAVEVTLGRGSAVHLPPAGAEAAVPVDASTPVAERWSGHVRILGLVAAGRYRAVLRIADELTDTLAVRSGQLLPELVEAGAHLRDVTVVRDSLAGLEQVARACPSPWSRGLLARSRALTSTIGAEDLFREAVAELTTVEASSQVGRTHLLYGEWLRRSRRRRDAADQLREAHRLLVEVDHPLVERTLRELSLAGASLDDADTDRLTSQELAIAKLAAAGARNTEIAEQLFISRHTVDYHLRKVYRKLGIRSRRGLHRAVSGF